jgi:hypothetical protein
MEYRFRNKDPIIDVLRTLVQSYAEIEGVTFAKALKAIERDSNDGLKENTMRGWFYGETRYPQYRFVARLVLTLKRYARRPVAIGDTKAYPVLRRAA